MRRKIGGRDTIDVGVTSNGRQFSVVGPFVVALALALLNPASHLWEYDKPENGYEEKAEERRQEDSGKGCDHLDHLSSLLLVIRSVTGVTDLFTISD
jgi:hypothetical protein